MFERLDEIERKYAALEARRDSPEVASDHVEVTKTVRAMKEIAPIVEKVRERRRVEEELAGAQQLADTLPAGDELQAMALSELEELRTRKAALEEELRVLLLPKDPVDSKNVVLEIRAGTGGDEAALFAGDLFRMYSRYAERQGWKIEILSSNAPDMGGFKEVIFSISGERVYSQLKFESGTHRVQRVPATESQGRIHTSTATVAVLPEAEDVDVQIEPNDLQIDVYRSSGPGGQSVNTTDSAVRVTHKPTGVVVSMQDEKSQLQNREKALRVLRARLFERAQAEQQAELAADRRSQVGTGDRAEKIRTYNYGERRVTDHRIKLTVHNLDQVLEGSLDELTAALQADEKRRRLEAQAAA